MSFKITRTKRCFYCIRLLSCEDLILKMCFDVFLFNSFCSDSQWNIHGSKHKIYIVCVFEVYIEMLALDLFLAPVCIRAHGL